MRRHLDTHTEVSVAVRESRVRWTVSPESVPGHSSRIVPGLALTCLQKEPSRCLLPAVGGKRVALIAKERRDSAVHCDWHLGAAIVFQQRPHNGKSLARSAVLFNRLSISAHCVCGGMWNVHYGLVAC